MHASDSDSGSPAKSPDVLNQTALIAGCGYVGHQAARRWVQQGIRTSAITRDATKAFSLLAENIQPVNLALGSDAEWPPLPDVDFVLWSVGFDRRPDSDRQATWVDGLQRLLQRLPQRLTPRRIIYTSSTGVYGDGEGHDVDEQTPLNPSSEGGLACVAAENLLRSWAQKTGDEVFILRLAGIYGPDRLLRRITELKNAAPIAAAPDEWLNLIHVDDAVRMIDWCTQTNAWEHMQKIAATTQPLDAATVNVVATNSVTRREYYATLARLVNSPEPVFQSAVIVASSDTSRRRSSGNRRVISRWRSVVPVSFEFDDCKSGLSDAVARSSMPPDAGE